MTPLNILVSFETEINKINDAVNKPNTDDSMYWLNQAVSKFVKLRFNGDLIHKTSLNKLKNEERILSICIKNENMEKMIF